MPTADSMLDVTEFKARTVMPSADVDIVGDAYLLARLKIWTSRIYARLRKRYSVPFASPIPEIVLGWLTAIVTVEAYQKRGWNPDDEQSAQIKADRDEALAEIKEAADAEGGLFDLPLRQNTTETGIDQGGPYVYAEASPYDWIDAQREALRGR